MCLMFILLYFFFFYSHLILIYAFLFFFILTFIPPLQKKFPLHPLPLSFFISPYLTFAPFNFPISFIPILHSPPYLSPLLLTIIQRNRFHLIGAEGKALVEEGETRTRQATSEIRVLRSNTGNALLVFSCFVLSCFVIFCLVLSCLYKSILSLYFIFHSISFLSSLLLVTFFIALLPISQHSCFNTSSFSLFSCVFFNTSHPLYSTAPQHPTSLPVHLHTSHIKSLRCDCYAYTCMCTCIQGLRRLVWGN